MLFVKVPKEIKDYEEKIFMGLAWRNIVWGIGSIATAILLYFILKGFLGEEITSYLVMLAALPGFACGFLKVQELPYNQYLQLIWKYYTKKQILVYENKIEREDQKHVSKKKRKRKKYTENYE